MKFVSEEHEKFYNDHIDINRRSPDYSALVYTLGIDDDPNEYTPKKLLSHLDDEHERGALMVMTYFA